MEEYLEQINRYLPMQFADKEANEFVQYLSEAYIENLENGKYQFAFTAFHMLNMIFVYKTKWFLKVRGNNTVISDALNNHKKLAFNNLFDLSQLFEKESLSLLLTALDFHKNDFIKCVNHVDARNLCSHAGGKIQYNKKGIDFLIGDEVEYIERLQKKMQPELKGFLEEFLEKNWSRAFMSQDFFETMFEENNFSFKDLELISAIDLPLFKKKSNKEKNLRQKILYLLLIFEIQNKVIAKDNLFLEKLPILMLGLYLTVKVERDGEEYEVHTSEIIEEFLIPLVSLLPDADRGRAEEILRLGKES